MIATCQSYVSDPQPASYTISEDIRMDVTTDGYTARVRYASTGVLIATLHYDPATDMWTPEENYEASRKETAQRVAEMAAMLLALNFEGKPFRDHVEAPRWYPKATSARASDDYIRRRPEQKPSTYG